MSGNILAAIFSPNRASIFGAVGTAFINIDLGGDLTYTGAEVSGEGELHIVMTGSSGQQSQATAVIETCGTCEAARRYMSMHL